LCGVARPCRRASFSFQIRSASHFFLPLIGSIPSMPPPTCLCFAVCVLASSSGLCVCAASPALRMPFFFRFPMPPAMATAQRARGIPVRILSSQHTYATPTHLLSFRHLVTFHAQHPCARRFVSFLFSARPHPFFIVSSAHTGRGPHLATTHAHTAVYFYVIQQSRPQLYLFIAHTHGPVAD